MTPVDLAVLVCGPRTMPTRFRDFVRATIRSTGATAIIEGGATGADTMANEAAMALGLPFATYKADWSLGRRAGPMRNQKMLDQGRPHLVLAFVPSTGITKGTADMVRRARAAGVPVREVVYEP